MYSTDFGRSKNICSGVVYKVCLNICLFYTCEYFECVPSIEVNLNSVQTYLLSNVVYSVLLDLIPGGGSGDPHRTASEP